MAGARRKRLKDKRLQIAIVLILLLPVWLVLAKYISSQIYIKQATGKEFYFRSTILADDGDNFYVINGFDTDSSTIDIDINNFLDEYRVSEADIKYKVAGNCINETNGTLAQSQKTDTVHISIPDVCFTDNRASLTITISTLAPYTKTLGGTFVVYKANKGLTFDVFDVEGQNYAYAILNTGELSGHISISYPSNAVFPDPTSSLYTIDQNQVLKINDSKADSEYAIVFLKSEPTNVYGSNDFTVSLSQE